MRILLTIILFSLLFQGCASSTAPAAPASAKAGAAGAAIASRAAVGFVYSEVSRVALPHRMGPSAAGGVVNGNW